NQKRAWEREKEKIEQVIAQLEKEQADIQVQMADNTTYDDKAKTLALIARQREVEATLGSKLARWEELCLALEGS
ncbi:ABC transporter C-terminal domain-containing protein, partial [Bdellovibrionota bacterium FG-2]